MTADAAGRQEGGRRRANTPDWQEGFRKRRKADASDRQDGLRQARESILAC
jgi:hypothetical protein